MLKFWPTYISHIWSRSRHFVTVDKGFLSFDCPGPKWRRLKSANKICWNSLFFFKVRYKKFLSDLLVCLNLQLSLTNIFVGTNQTLRRRNWLGWKCDNFLKDAVYMTIHELDVGVVKKSESQQPCKFFETSFP